MAGRGVARGDRISEVNRRGFDGSCNWLKRPRPGTPPTAHESVPRDWADRNGGQVGGNADHSFDLLAKQVPAGSEVQAAACR